MKGYWAFSPVPGRSWDSGQLEPVTVALLLLPLIYPSPHHHQQNHNFSFDLFLFAVGLLTPGEGGDLGERVSRVPPPPVPTNTRFLSLGSSKLLLYWQQPGKLASVREV